MKYVPAPKPSDKGETPLHCAAHGKGDKSEIVELLLASSADPNLVDHQGRSPLDLARQNGKQGMVKLFQSFIECHSRLGTSDQ